MGTWARRISKRWVWLGLVGGALGCSGQDADRLARVGRTAAAKAEDLTGGARNRLTGGWQALRGSWAEATPDSRVAARLHWDKSLAGAAIQVSSPGNGQVRLQGTVADLSQRRRAVELAQATLGVEEVLDELTTQPIEK
jgi:osmotically-inducible protein OsmY